MRMDILAIAQTAITVVVRDGVTVMVVMLLIASDVQYGGVFIVSSRRVMHFLHHFDAVVGEFPTTLLLLLLLLLHQTLLEVPRWFLRA